MLGRINPMTEEQFVKTAQACYAKWLAVVDSNLQDAEISFEEAIGAGQNGDWKGAGDAFARAEQAVKQARAELRIGLAAGGSDAP